MNVSTSCTSPAKVPSACLWFCSMSLFTSFTNQSKMSQMAGHWFCSIISSKISCTNFGDKVLDFVACFQERSDFPLQNQEPIQYMLGNNGFRGTILYRIKVLPSHLSPLQNQDLMDPKKNGLMEMILLQNQESEFHIWLPYTISKTHTCWTTGVSGNYPFQNQRP